MDWLTFISTVVSSLAWPAAILVLGFMFKNDLSSFITTLRRIKFGSLEAEIGERTRRVEDAAEKIEDTGPDLPPLRESYAEIEERLRETARNTPRGAILEAWLLVESASIELLRERGSHDFKSHPGPARLRDYLIKDHLLSATQKIVFESLRELRNDAVHVADASITTQDAYRYIESAKKLAYSLERKRMSPRH